MTRLVWSLVAMGLLWLGADACSTTSSASHGDRERWKAKLMQTDAEFSRAAQTRGVGEAFAAYAAENATMMPVGESPAVGRAAIRKEFEGLPAEATLTWKPFAADVAGSGDLGYTLGDYEYRAPGPDGKMATHYGKYCTVWKKQADGRWKWVADIGNASPAPK
jgi:ketosteroid isomerase-like protein